MTHDEELIQGAIAEYLTIRNVFFHSIPNEGVGAGSGKANAMRRMARLKRMGLRKGVPDLLIWFPMGDGGVRIGYAEIKTEKGVLSKEQKGMANKCALMHVPYILARSLDSFVAKFNIVCKGGIPCTGKYTAARRCPAYCDGECMNEFPCKI